MRRWCTLGQVHRPNRPPRTPSSRMVVRGSDSRGARPVPIGPRSRPKAHSVHIWQKWRHPDEAAVAGSRPAACKFAPGGPQVRRLPVGQGVSEAVCKPSSVPARLSAHRGWPSIWGRRSPDGSCGRPEGWAAHLSPANGHPYASCALLFGLAPGGVCPFHSGLRFAPKTGIVTVALVLASRRAGVTRHPALRSSDFPHAIGGVAPTHDARPSDRLADWRSLPRAGQDPVDDSAARRLGHGRVPPESTISRRADGPPTSARQRGRDRWPHWPARPRRS